MSGELGVKQYGRILRIPSPTGFSVSLVPLTRARTNLTGRRLGEQVNVETDLLARCVEQLIGDAEGSPT